MKHRRNGVALYIRRDFQNKCAPISHETSFVGFKCSLNAEERVSAGLYIRKTGGQRITHLNVILSCFC